MMLAVPFYLHDAYFDLVQAKYTVLHTGIIISALTAVLSLFFKRKKVKTNYGPLEYLLLIFAVISLLSSLCSGSFVTSFFGEEGWGIGSLVLSFSIILIIFYRDTDIYEDMWIIVAAANMIIFLISFLHSAEIDVFDLHLGIDYSQYHSYFSLLGNTNWIAGYLCLLLPVMFFRYVNEKRKSARTIYLVCLILGIGNMVLTNSDALYVGLAIAMAFGLPRFLEDLNKYRGILLLPAVMGIYLLMIRTMPFFFYKYDSFSGITLFLSNYAVLIPIILLSAVLYIVSFRYRPDEGIRKLISVVFACVVVMACGYLLFDMLQHYRNYQYDWGNNRLRIWMEALFAYSHYLRPGQMLIGVGPEMQAGWLGYLERELNAVFLVCHSEPVQLLLTTGICGLGVCIASLICAVVDHLKNRTNARRLPYFLALIGYLGTALFNSMSPLCAGIFFVMLSMFIKNGK